MESNGTFSDWEFKKNHTCVQSVKMNYDLVEGGVFYRYREIDERRRIKQICVECIRIWNCPAKDFREKFECPKCKAVRIAKESTPSV